VSVRYQPTGRTAVDLAESVEAGARDGFLVPGERLPPVRELAASAGVSPGTVAAAYRLLRARGVTLGDGRRGTRIRERAPATGRAADAAELGPGVLDCSTGNPDPALLPDLGPVLRRARYEKVLYGASPCLAELAAAARVRLAREGVPTEAVTATFGTLDAIERALVSRLGPGDRVAVEDPGWAALLDLVTATGFVPAPLAVDDEGPVPAALERALARGTRAVVLTSRAQNPTGAAISESRCRELRALLGAYPEVTVLEDDHGDGIVASPLRPVVGSTRHWAFLRSAAKAYGPDLRIAVVAGDEATISRIDARLALGAGWVSHFVQRLLLELWQDPEIEAQLDRAVRGYESRRVALLEALRDRGVWARGPSGLNCWIPVDDEAATVGALLRAAWLVAPGSRFRLGSPPAIRVTTAALGTDRAPELAAAISAALGGMRGSGARRLT
jgi:DNA-binding transcriptional MocR family regulator